MKTIILIAILSVSGIKCLAAKWNRDKPHCYLQSTTIQFLASIPDGNDSTTPNLLSIELLNFTAVQNKNSIDIKWSNASETNNNFFVVERSKDALVFETV